MSLREIYKNIPSSDLVEESLFRSNYLFIPLITTLLWQYLPNSLNVQSRAHSLTNLLFWAHWAIVHPFFWLWSKTCSYNWHHLWEIKHSWACSIMVGLGPNREESIGFQRQDHFFNLEQREIVKLVSTPLIPIGVILEVGVMCPTEKTPKTCS